MIYLNNYMDVRLFKQLLGRGEYDALAELVQDAINEIQEDYKINEEDAENAIDILETFVSSVDAMNSALYGMDSEFELNLYN